MEQAGSTDVIVDGTLNVALGTYTLIVETIDANNGLGSVTLRTDTITISVLEVARVTPVQATLEV